MLKIDELISKDCRNIDEIEIYDTLDDICEFISLCNNQESWNKELLDNLQNFKEKVKVYGSNLG